MSDNALADRLEAASQELMTHAYEYTGLHSCGIYANLMDEAAAALRSQQAAGVQEPYGWLYFTKHMERRFVHRKPTEPVDGMIGEPTPVYAAPAVPQGWVSVPAAGLLAIRDALTSNDTDDAYHRLYTLVKWNDPYKPWADWESMLSASPREGGKVSHYCGVAEARGKMPCGNQCDECRLYEQGESEMITNETQRAEFETLTRPLMKWLNENCHPHVMVTVETTGAQLHEGVCSTGEILDYVKG